MEVFIMELPNIFDKFLVTQVKNIRYFERYKKLITFYHDRQFKKSKNNFGEYELHHILPVKIYPEYSKEKWNIITLPAKAHYIAHYLLFKSIRHKSCIYAFNQMRRITKNKNPKCRLYAEVKKNFASIISENNKGRPKTDSQLFAISEANKEKNTYRSPTGELKRFFIGDEPEGWVSFQTGRIRSNESKKKIQSIMSGRLWQYHPINKDVKFEKTLLPDYIAGFPPWFSVPSGSKNSIWIHHRHTGKNKRLKNTEPLPEEFIFGRNFENVGFDKINNQNYVRVLDLINKKFCLVKKQELIKSRYVKHGGSIDNIYLYKYNKIVYTSLKDFLEVNSHLPKTSGGKNILSKKIPAPHYNQTQEKNKFSKLNQGKTFADIGVEVFNIHEYTFNKEEIYVRCNRS
jgi:hypothetical protein